MKVGSLLERNQVWGINMWPSELGGIERLGACWTRLGANEESWAIGDRARREEEPAAISLISE